MDQADLEALSDDELVDRLTNRGLDREDAKGFVKRREDESVASQLRDLLD